MELFGLREVPRLNRAGQKVSDTTTDMRRAPRGDGHRAVRRHVAVAPGVVALFPERVGQCDPAHWRPADFRRLEQSMSVGVQSQPHPKRRQRRGVWLRATRRPCTKGRAAGNRPLLTRTDMNQPVGCTRGMLLKSNTNDEQERQAPSRTRRATEPVSKSRPPSLL